jgi:hypothetical protein
MSEEINMDWSRFETALQRRLATSSRDHLMVLADQARGIMRQVVDITPPGSQGVKGTTRAARAMGQTAVARDIRKLYGTPGDAYETIRQRNSDLAAGFWKQLKEGNRAAASEILRSISGVGVYAFDGGTLHKRHKNRRGRVQNNRVVMYVEDDKPLTDYITMRQKNVNFLQAGWKPAAGKLGFSLPASIAGHQAPGAVVLEVTATRLRLVAENRVEFAARTDLARRIQWAINAQAGAMERQMERFTQTFNRQAGL